MYSSSSPSVSGRIRRAKVGILSQDPPFLSKRIPDIRHLDIQPGSWWYICTYIIGGPGTWSTSQYPQSHFCRPYLLDWLGPIDCVLGLSTFSSALFKLTLSKFMIPARSDQELSRHIKRFQQSSGKPLLAVMVCGEWTSSLVLFTSLVGLKDSCAASGDQTILENTVRNGYYRRWDIFPLLRNLKMMFLRRVWCFD